MVFIIQNLKNQNWTYDKIIVIVILAIILVSGVFLFQTNSPKYKAQRVQQIIHTDNIQKIDFLREILTIKDNNPTIIVAQINSLNYLIEKKDLESVSSIIKLYHNTFADIYTKSLCLLALGKLPSSEGTFFMLKELKSTKNLFLQKVILDRLFEIYFLVEEDIQLEIYQIYKDFQHIQNSQYARNILGCLHGDADSYKILLDLAKDMETRYTLASTFNLDKITITEYIKQSDMLMNILKYLHEVGDKNIHVYTQHFFD